MLHSYEITANKVGVQLSGYNTTNPTCISTGVKYNYCLYGCGYNYNSTVAATGNGAYYYTYKKAILSQILHTHKKITWCGYCREELDSTSESHGGTWNEYGTATCPQCGAVYSYA